MLYSENMSPNDLPTWLLSVHHDGSEKYVSNPYPRLGEHVLLRLRTSPQAPLEQVYLRIAPDGEQAFLMMQPGPLEPAARWWQVELTVQEPLVHYRFILAAGDGAWFYNAAGAFAHEPLDSFDFRLLADYTPPEWVQASVFYQIFPDRFANGQPANDPQPHEYDYRGHRPATFPWGELPPKDQTFPLVFYGGDLQGILQKLDYLEELGVNALYLNPIFTAYSNHKYDVIDYAHVDPHFGGDAALQALRRALDERGMRYLLDIVPNHCGYWHPWFQAARQDAAAPEADFFTFTQRPDAYASWLGVWSLPKLNYRSPELRGRIYEGEQAVFRRWLQAPFAADGWRVDVANMLARQGASQMGTEIARGIRQAVKETQAQAYLIGENFFDATSQLQGDQWDGVMNYAGLAFPLLDWLRGFHRYVHGITEVIRSPQPWPTQALAAMLQERLASIPWSIALQQYNLLDSHDTGRLRSLLGENVALQRLAALVQFTFPGVPGLYYGDEIGLLDLPELGSRGCMPWDRSKWNQDLLAFYQQLIRLRRSSPILQRGGFQILAVEQDLLAYQREVGRRAHAYPGPALCHPAPAWTAPGGARRHPRREPLERVFQRAYSGRLKRQAGAARAAPGRQFMGGKRINACFGD